MHNSSPWDSRSQDRADAFADVYDVPNRHASYEALAEDPEVDAVYVATPHPFHKENSILCLKAGKPVLCEKPFTINQHEARKVIEVARSEGVFLMEAMWTRFLPITKQVKAWVTDGAIGEVQIQGTQYLIILPLFWPWFFLFQRPAQRPLNPANKSLIPQGSARARMGITELSIVSPELVRPLTKKAKGLRRGLIETPAGLASPTPGFATDKSAWSRFGRSKSA